MKNSDLRIRANHLLEQLDALDRKPFFARAQEAPVLIALAALLVRDLVVEFDALRDSVAVTVARVDNLSEVVFKTGEEKIL